MNPTQEVPAGGHAAVSNNEFLTFTLGKEEYGIDILSVQEIRGYDAVTAIANTPEFIKGVINLCGIIAPIVDMRIKFNLGKAEYNPVHRNDHPQPFPRVVCMVMDGVSDVITLTEKLMTSRDMDLVEMTVA